MTPLLMCLLVVNVALALMNLAIGYWPGLVVNGLAIGALVMAVREAK